MTASLRLVRTRVDRTALTAFAASTGTLDDDLGYALHLALRRRFGVAAPQPFLRMEARDGLDRLFGYSADPASLLAPRARPSELPDPLGDWADASQLDRIFPEPFEAKPMPTDWRTDQRLAFDLRVRPIVRYGDKALAARSGEKKGGGERDVFLAALEARDATGGDRDSDPREREAVYRAWLGKHLAPAATIETMRLVSHRRIRVVRSRHARPGNQPSPKRRFDGPETFVTGTLTVADPGRFQRLLARGVGRHTAFGFGMLLLRPPPRHGG